MAFSFFGKKRIEISCKDVLWINTQSQMQGAYAILNQHSHPILISWFEETMAEWKKYSESHLTLCEHVLARDVKVSKTEGQKIFLTGHFPLFQKEQDHFELWKASEIMVFNSLEQPLLKHFGGDSIVAMMKKMGASDSEEFQNTMISASIQSAQKKLDKQVTNELLSNSEEGWFANNFLRT